MLHSAVKMTCIHSNPIIIAIESKSIKHPRNSAWPRAKETEIIRSSLFFLFFFFFLFCPRLRQCGSCLGDPRHCGLVRGVCVWPCSPGAPPGTVHARPGMPPARAASRGARPRHGGRLPGRLRGAASVSDRVAPNSCSRDSPLA